MLVLSNDDIERCLPMDECMAALEEAYAELSAGRGVNRVRSDCLVPAQHGEAIYSLKSMDGVIPKLGVGAVRIDSDIVTWPKHGNSMRRVKVPSANGRYVGLVLLFSTETGAPLAIMPDGVMQRIRVGAANGLGIRYLARGDARRIGLIGSGWQAGTQLTAACAARPIEAVRCFSPNRERREAFARQMSEQLGLPVEAVAQPEDAVGGADIVICATSSIDHVFFARWIEPGMHLSSIKVSELERAAIEGADRLVVHTHDTKPLHVTTRDLAVPEREGNKGWALSEGLDLSKAPTLADVIAGKAQRRQSPREVTCFLNNLGMGYQFAAAGAVVYRKARDGGLGHELPDDWFTQDVHP